MKNIYINNKKYTKDLIIQWTQMPLKLFAKKKGG